MSDHDLPRWAPATGALAFVLLLAGLVVSVAAGRPQITMASSPDEVARALADPVGAGNWIGVAIESVALSLFLVFAAALTGLRATRTGGSDALARAAFGCAVAFVAVSFAALVVGGLVGDLAGEPVDLPTAVLLNDLWGGLYTASWAPCGAFLVLGGLALWNAGVLARGLLAAAVVIGAASLVVVAAPDSGAGQAIGFLPWLWFAAVSIILVVRSRRAPGRARAAAASV